MKDDELVRLWRFQRPAINQQSGAAAGFLGWLKKKTDISGQRVPVRA